jgi:hypothetical protein
MNLWISLGLLLAFAFYLLQSWWTYRSESTVPKTLEHAQDAHFSFHLYTHVDDFCEGHSSSDHN